MASSFGFFVILFEISLQKFLIDSLTRFNDDVDEVHTTNPADEDGSGQDELVRRTVAHRD